MKIERLYSNGLFPKIGDRVKLIKPDVDHLMKLGYSEQYIQNNEFDKLLDLTHVVIGLPKDQSANNSKLLFWQEFLVLRLENTKQNNNILIEKRLSNLMRQSSKVYHFSAAFVELI